MISRRLAQHLSERWGQPVVAIALPHVTSGKVKAYAVASTERFAGAPSIPTAIEAGLLGFESSQWIGVVVPARTPAAVVAKLNRTIGEIMQSRELRDALVTSGA